MGDPAPSGSDQIRVVAPGRVNIIGDHTDYTGGLALPMAIDRATTLAGTFDPGRISLSSAEVEGTVELDLTALPPAGEVRPEWGRYVAAVAAELGTPGGVIGEVTSTIPTASGLSSSAALEVAVALALGFEGPPLQLAQLCQRAEHAAVGVPSGLMDQLAICAAEEGSAVLMDCHALTAQPVSMPDEVELVVIDSGEPRTLAGSAYEVRVRQCEAAEAIVGPLRLADPSAVADIEDSVVAARARHVISENQRVRDAAEALSRSDAESLGRLMDASHRSLATDYEVSTPTLEALIRELGQTEGVLGARVTGAGFGGCVVALTRPGTIDAEWGTRSWVVAPAAGARRLD